MSLHQYVRFLEPVSGGDYLEWDLSCPQSYSVKKATSLFNICGIADEAFKAGRTGTMSTGQIKIMIPYGGEKSE